MNESSEFLEDENSKASLLQNLPDMVASCRVTWNRISQSLWSTSAFEKLYDVVSEIAGMTALHDMQELSKQATAIKQYFDGFMDTNKVPTSTQVEQVNQLFDLLEQAQVTNQQQNQSGNKEQNHMLFILCQETPTTVEVATLLKEQQYDVHAFQDIEALTQGLQKELPAAIIVETDLLPGITPLKNEIARQMSLKGKPIPLVFISSHDDISTRIAAMKAGANRYFSPPHDSNQICAEIISIATPRHHKDRVLIIEDDPTQAEFAASILAKADMLTETVTHPLEVMQALKNFNPDIILMDIYMPDANGMELTTVIRDDMRFVTTPIIFLSGETNPEKQIDALILGGDDFISKPIRPKFLIATIQNRIKRTRDLIHAIKLQYADESSEAMPGIAADAITKNVDLDLLSENTDASCTAEQQEPLTHDEILRDKIIFSLQNGKLKNSYQPVLSIQGEADDNYSLIVTMPDDKSTLDWDEIAIIARKYDLQHDIDHWAVEQAVNSIHELTRKGKQGTLFVAQSSHDVVNDADPEWIRAILRAKQMVGTNLVLGYNLNELTSNIQSSKNYFSKLQDMGIKICLSDFPAKKVAFKLLQFLKVDYVKVSNKLLETDNSVINSFINQAHRLRVSVIVADISDPRYVNLHWTSNADLIQGDFISPPSETMNFNFSQAAL